MLPADGERVKPDAVVWGTGYRPAWDWLDPELLGPDGLPRHREGIGEPAGLYLLGLWRLRSRGSALLGFVRHDAERIAKAVLARR